MFQKQEDRHVRHEKSPGIAHAAVLLTVLFLAGSSAALAGPAEETEERVLRIHDWKTGEVYAEVPARVGSRLFFGWVHSLEKIPWNEYFHVDAENNLVLDAIDFPAFGAGIPENKGRICYVKDGLIHMEEIGQVFPELHWLNSQVFTRDISLDGALVARGADLPQHARLRLVIEKK
ncbi:MAG: DUF1850 domain-containing protein [Burkholderiales bacterium]|jgi:hypothetical protein|nr:DUF1850 domain-containing protein [Burkholderiales bacterium]